MKEYDVFLSYRSSDYAEVARVAEALSARGLRVFLDRFTLKPGQDWLQAVAGALEASRAIAVFVGEQGLGAWQDREVGLALIRKARDPAFRVIPVLLPKADPPTGFLELHTWVDLSDPSRRERGLDILAAAIRGEPPPPDDLHVLAARSAASPYRGLLTFGELDAPFFFGRDAEAEELLDRVRRTPFVAVVGPSGTGKSSLVRAGLLPRLHQLRGSHGERDWDVLTLVPTWRPCHAVAEAILDRLRPDLPRDERRDRVEQWGEDLLEGRKSLRALLAGDVLEIQPRTQRLLVFLDQFEELWTLCENEGHRRRFLDELLAALADERIRIVVTVRADFYGRLQEHHGLNERLADAVLNLGPLTDDGLRAVIVEPARRTGIGVDPALVDTILDDVRQEPGHLPLLEFVLHEMWKESRGRGFDLATYGGVGRVEGAVRRRAEHVWEKLNAREQLAAERLFLQLVQVGEGTRDTRRRARLTDLASEARAVVERLAHRDVRLIVTDRDAELETAEIGHEALLSCWPRLREFIDRNREFLAWRKRSAETVRRWAETRDRSLLWRGRVLLEARDWRMARDADLTADERRFIDASLRAARRGVILRRTAAVAVAALAAFATWMWWRSERQAERLEETSRRLELQSIGWRLEQVQRSLYPEYPTFSEHAREMRYWLDIAKDLRDVWLPRIEEELRALDPRVDQFVDRALRESLATTAVELRAWVGQWSDRLSQIGERLDWLDTNEGHARLAEYDRRWDEVIASGRASRRMPGLVPLLGPGVPTVEERRQAGLPPMERLQHYAHLASGPKCRTLPDLEELEAWAEKPGSGGIVLVAIPGGTFKMGSEDEDSEGYDVERPQHDVRVAAFLLATTEVTRGQYVRFLSAVRRSHAEEIAEDENGQEAASVAWEEAQVFCKWVGLRLPSEAEWEYACRAGTTTRYWSGDSEDDLARVGWYTENSGVATEPVAQKPANPWGLFDVHGNVLEWCQDTWQDDYEGAPTDGSAWEDDGSGFRVMRGGSWNLVAWGCRSAYRARWHPGNRLGDVGFRPASSSLDHLTTSPPR